MNCFFVRELAAPFGGARDSGLGREGGNWSFDFYCDVKNVAVRKGSFHGGTELGYMGLGVSDLEAWKAFAREIVGLEVVDEGEKDRCYLRMDYWHHRLVLHRDASDDLAYLGFRVAGPDEFVETQKQLADAGIEFRVGSLEEAEERRVLEVHEARRSRRQPDRDLPRAAGALQQALPSRAAACTASS